MKICGAKFYTEQHITRHVTMVDQIKLNKTRTEVIFVSGLIIKHLHQFDPTDQVEFKMLILVI